MSATDNTMDTDANASWQEVIDRRSREIEDGQVICQPMDQTIQNIRAKLYACRQPPKPAKDSNE